MTVMMMMILSVIEKLNLMHSKALSITIIVWLSDYSLVVPCAEKCVYV